MGEKSVKTLCSEIRFNVDLFIDCTDHSVYTTLPRISENERYKMLKYQKVSFSTFVTHCLLDQVWDLDIFIWWIEVRIFKIKPLR